MGLSVPSGGLLLGRLRLLQGLGIGMTLLLGALTGNILWARSAIRSWKANLWSASRKNRTLAAHTSFKSSLAIVFLRRFACATDTRRTDCLSCSPWWAQAARRSLWHTSMPSPTVACKEEWSRESHSMRSSPRLEELRPSLPTDHSGSQSPFFRRIRIEEEQHSGERFPIPRFEVKLVSSLEQIEQSGHKKLPWARNLQGRFGGVLTLQRERISKVGPCLYLRLVFLCKRVSGSTRQ
eukprot:3000953-Amphidinium_carterae.2